MFINCPYCHALVATNPATDEPPPQCPRCAAVLRKPAPVPEAGVADADVPDPDVPDVDVPDAGEPDAGMPDEGVPAAAVPGASVPDADVPDADVADADVADADVADAGMPDEGMPVAGDAGAGLPLAGIPDAGPADGVAQDDRTHDATAPHTAAPDARAADASTAGVRGHDAPHADRVTPAGPAADAPMQATTIAPIAAAAPEPVVRRVPVLAALLRRGQAASAPPTPPSAPPDALQPAPARVERGLDTQAPEHPQSPSPVPTVTHEPARATATEAAPASGVDTAAPSFVPRLGTHAHGARWLLPSIVAGLVLVLAMQWLLADRDRLAADARWRPLVLQACSLWRCTVAPWHEPSALVLLDRDVRAHPAIPGALRVTASFRNEARWAQRWPHVLLTLSDVDGQQVGARAFAPAEYLRARPPAGGLASGATAIIRLDVVEPAPRVVAFAFEFH